MKFEYIQENLLYIMENPEAVMYIKAYDIGKQRALFAVVKAEDGVYKKVQITKGQSKLNFPVEPMFLFSQGPGFFFLENFYVYDNLYAFNKDYFEGFKSKDLDNRTYFNLGVYAVFNDGTATHIINDNNTTFNLKGGVKQYIRLLDTNNVSFTQTHDKYEIIERYQEDDDTFVIPKLRNKKDKVYRKVGYTQV